MNQHEERLAVAALFAEQLAKARHIIATTEARIAASDAVIDQMAQALTGGELPVYLDRERVERALAGPRWTIPHGMTPEQIVQYLNDVAAGKIEPDEFEVTKGAETVHRHTEPTAPRWPLTVATDGERNGRLAWVPGL